MNAIAQPARCGCRFQLTPPSLLVRFEVEVAPLHPKISHAPVLGLSPDDLSLDAWHDMVAYDANQRSQEARRIELESMAAVEEAEGAFDAERVDAGKGVQV